MGYGPVFNVGEPYLGTSAPGFAILLALLHFVLAALNLPALIAWFSGAGETASVTALDIPHLARYLSAVSVALIGFVAYAFMVRAHKSWLAIPFGVLVALWILTRQSVITVAGHETLTFIALTLLGLYYVRVRPLLCGLLLGLATLVRPDAAAAFLVALGVTACPWLRNRTRVDFRRVIGSIAGFSAVVLPWIFFSWLFYGSPLPGTLLAKQAQVGLGAWPVTSLELLFQEIARTVPDIILPPFLLFGAFGILRAVIKRDRVLVIAIWGLVHLLAYALLKVTFWSWYATPLVAIFLILVFYGMTSMVHLIWTIQGSNSWARSSTSTGSTLTPTKLEGVRFLAVPIGALLLFVSGVALSPSLGFMSAGKAIHEHTSSFRQVADYILMQTPNGAKVATPEPGALAYFLGPKFYVLDTLGLTAPGVAAHLLKRDFEWPYLYYDPDWVLVSYTGVINPNLSKDWYKTKYREVEQFSHPYWDAQGITLRLFRKR